MEKPRIGDDSVVINKEIVDIGDRSVFLGATDNNCNTILTTPLAMGYNARAGPNSIAIGAGACAGTGTDSEPQDSDLQD